MTSRKFRILTFLFFVILGAFPLSYAFSAGFTIPDRLPAPITTAEKAAEIIYKVGLWMLGILLVLAVIFLLIAAYYYLTTGGSEDGLEKAKNYIHYTIVAIIVALLAGGIPLLVYEFVTGDSEGFPIDVEEGI